MTPNDDRFLAALEARHRMTRWHCCPDGFSWRITKGSHPSVHAGEITLDGTSVWRREFPSRASAESATLRALGRLRGAV
jgi:hypothetical protein